MLTYDAFNFRNAGTSGVWRKYFDEISTQRGKDSLLKMINRVR